MPPTAKEIKYDRQLRLWSANGQEALENTKLCLINATATGTEILKNLVLPGIGAFTILDDKITDGEDAGVNFFLDETSIGQPRGEEAYKYISELNPDVRGDYVVQSPEHTIINNPEFFHQFSIVIATGLNEQVGLTLSKVLWDAHIHFILVDQVGFMGAFRIATPELTLVETHPEDVVDLRLDCPWPELAHLASTFDYEQMDEFEHGHIPYIIILLRAIEQWKQMHGEPPRMKDRKEFNKLILQEKRDIDEENFDEAIAASFRACKQTEIPSDIKTILSDKKAQHLTPESPSFWILAKCVADFVDDIDGGNGLLPLMGTVPDMKADSNRYIVLQNCYRNKFKKDLENVTYRVKQTLRNLGRHENEITQAEVESFCKNAGYLKVIHYRSLEDEYTSPRVKFIQGEFENEFPPTVIHYYLAFRAFDRFLSKYNRPPSSADHETLVSLVTEVLTAPPANEQLVSDACAEICRAVGGELHNIASLMGGLVAQEAIKLITRQYIPSDNTCVFDGHRMIANVWAL